MNNMSVTSTPAFSCSACAPQQSSIQSRSHCFRTASTFTQTHTRRTRGRPRFRPLFTASSSSSPANEDSNEEDPLQIPNPVQEETSTSSIPSTNWSSLSSTGTSRKPSIGPHLVTSVSLNLKGRLPIPSCASVERFTADLRPHIDYLEPKARTSVLAALEVANVAHQGQTRKSGEPYIIHPIAVAAILADMRMDRDCIIAGLLHDTVEDTPVTLEELERLFGKDVKKIVEGETKFSKLAKKVHLCDDTKENTQSSSTSPSVIFTDKNHNVTSLSNVDNQLLSEWERKRQKKEEEQQKQADNLRAMFVAMTEDVRVIIVKLADRLHNMRTLGYMSPAKQKKISKETLEIFAPLAHRLGMRRIKSELEELAFRFLHPEDYKHLKYEVDTLLKRSRFHEHLKNAEAVVRDVLEKDRFLYNMIRSVDVIGAPKELYSIYRRIQAGENLASMLDIGTMRVVVDLDPGVNNQACYQILGRIHSMWKPLPKRLKDYIAFPKPNGYQSLHTTVLLGQKFDFYNMEIQIRTKEMHRIAEEGVAAQLFQPGALPSSPQFFKDDDREDDTDLDDGGQWKQRTKGWLISIREYLEEFTSSRDLVDAVRKDLLGNRVFVFTPKGRIVDLPQDSTPIDVAYRIHSDLGNKMIAAKVNGRLVQLDYKLQNADVVNIISSSASAGPLPDWIGYAKSRTARQKIRQFLRSKDRDNMLDRGRRILEKEARSSMEPIPSEAGLAEILPRLSVVVSSCTSIKDIMTLDDLYIAIARGCEESDHFSLPRTVLGLLREHRHAVITETANTEKSSIDELEMKSAFVDSPVRRRGFLDEDTEVLLAPCCHPIRGDDIVGFCLNGGKNKAILVHRMGCDHLSDDVQEEDDSKKAIKLKWAVQSRGSYEDLSDNNISISDDDINRIQELRGLTMPISDSTNEAPTTQPARVIAVARDCTGLLAYISGVLASTGTSIRRSATITDSDTMLATLAFEVLVRDTYHMRQVLRRIEECEEVESARRLGPTESQLYFPLPMLKASDQEGDAESLRLLRGGQRIAASDLEEDEDQGTD